MITRSTIEHKISTFLFLLSALFISFPQKIASIILGLWVLSSLFLLALNGISKESSADKNKHLPHILLICLFILFLTSYFFSTDIQAYFRLLETRLPLLLLPCLALIKPPKVKFHTVLFFYLTGCTSYLVFLCWQSFYCSLSADNLFFFRDYNLFIQIAQHFRDITHPAYLGTNYLLSIVAIVYLISKGYRSTSHILFFSAYSITVILVVLLISSRAVAVSMFFIMLFYCVFLALHRVRMLLYFLPVFLFITIITLTFSSRIQESFQKLVQGKTEEMHDPRIDILKSSSKALSSLPILGYGTGSVQAVLNEKYTETRFEEGLKNNYNAHNQYMEFALEVGWGGLLIFILLLISILRADPLKRIFYIPFVIIFFVNFFFESMLNRFAGVILFSFFTAIIPLENGYHTHSKQGKSIFHLLIIVLLTTWISGFSLAKIIKNRIAINPNTEYLLDQTPPTYHFGSSVPSVETNDNCIFYFPYLTLYLPKNKTLTFNVDCFVHKDFAIDWARIWGEDKTRTPLGFDEYNMTHHGSWQTLQLIINGKNQRVTLFFQFMKFQAKNFQDLEETVIFKNPRYRID